MGEERVGWRARIGLISPAGAGLTIMREWSRFLPEGVVWQQTLISITEATPEGLLELKERVVAEGRKFPFGASMDILFFACTSASFIGGTGYDKGIIKELEAATGIPSTTASTCVLTAFADLGVKKIGLVGPYTREVFDIEIQFLKDQGVDVLYCKGLGYADPKQYPIISEQPYTYYRAAKEAFRSAPDADVIFVSSMSSSIANIVTVLEQEMTKPVISSASASLYGVLKQLGIKEPIEGYGTLLKIPR